MRNRISKSSVFYLGNDFFDHFGSAVCGICVAAPTKSIDISLQLITKSKLGVVTVVSRLLGIVFFYSTFLVSFHIDHTAVDMNGNKLWFFLSQQLCEDLAIDVSQNLCCFWLKLPKNRDTVSGSFTEISNASISGSPCRSLILSSLSIPI